MKMANGSKVVAVACVPREDSEVNSNDSVNLSENVDSNKENQEKEN